MDGTNQRARLNKGLIALWSGSSDSKERVGIGKAWYKEERMIK